MVDVRRSTSATERALLHGTRRATRALYGKPSRAATRCRTGTETLRDFVRVMPVEYKQAVDARSATTCERHTALWVIHKGSSRCVARARRGSPSSSACGTGASSTRRCRTTRFAAQGARCMDCGVPFCQGDTGCPVHNVIPEWNDLVSRGRWREATDVLHSTNNFPELTGRLCPAPCESACVLSLIDQPVTIRTHRAGDRRSRVRRRMDRARSRRVARPGVASRIVGSGPAGLAAAQQLRRARPRRDRVRDAPIASAACCATAFQTSNSRRRCSIDDSSSSRPRASNFETGVDVGTESAAAELRRDFDAVPARRRRTVGARPRVSRSRARRHSSRDGVPHATESARRGRIAIRRVDDCGRGKHVVIIGGGDTGSDCAGTCLRQGATSVTQFELMPQPPADARGLDAVAALADAAPDVARARGGVRARLGGRDDAFSGDER